MSLTPMSSAEIKAARAELGLSQAKLAAALGIATRTVEDWEAGKGGPPPYLRLALQVLKEASAPKKPAVQAPAAFGPVRASPGSRLKKR